MVEKWDYGGGEDKEKITDGFVNAHMMMTRQRIAGVRACLS